MVEGNTGCFALLAGDFEAVSRKDLTRLRRAGSSEAWLALGTPGGRCLRALACFQGATGPGASVVPYFARQSADPR